MHGTRLLLALATSAGLEIPDAAAQVPEGESLQLRMAAELAMGSPQAAPAPKVIPLEVTINGARAGNWALLENEGVLYAPVDAFEEWRLNRDPRIAPFLEVTPGMRVAFRSSRRAG